MNHKELVARAERWLKNSVRCPVVLTERHAFGESPDAIGWNRRGSFLVECKISRGDFRRDRKKRWRQLPEMGMGNFRYFLVPPKLVTAEEVPDGWGLLYAFPTMIRRIKEPMLIPNTKMNICGERLLLCYAFARAVQSNYK